MNILSVIRTTPFMFFYYKLNDELENIQTKKLALNSTSLFHASSSVLLGLSEDSRVAPIYFRRPPDRDSFYGDKDLPDLAMRDGKWKFLCEYDGSEPELYDIVNDLGEKNNLAETYPKLVAKFTKACINWHSSMPPDNGPNLVGDVRRKALKK